MADGTQHRPLPPEMVHEIFGSSIKPGSQEGFLGPMHFSPVPVQFEPDGGGGAAMQVKSFVTPGLQVSVAMQQRFPPAQEKPVAAQTGAAVGLQQKCLFAGHVPVPETSPSVEQDTSLQYCPEMSSHAAAEAGEDVFIKNKEKKNIKSENINIFFTTLSYINL